MSFFNISQRRYSRRVSPTERFSLALHRWYRYQVDCVFEGTGAVDLDQLENAVALAAEANPGIRVHLRGFLIFARWVDCGVAPAVQKLPTTAWDGYSQQGAEFLESRLNPRRAVADVLIVPCQDGRTRIVFRSLHAAIDGRGFMHWVLEVCRAMRKEPLQGPHSSLIDYDVQARFQAQIANEAAPRALSAMPIVPASSSTQSGKFHYVWKRVVINQPVQQLLTKTAAFLAAWARKYDSGDVAFTIPIDYRGLRTQEMGIGNLTGYLRLEVTEQMTPRRLMQQLATKIRAFEDCQRPPGIHLLRWIPTFLIARMLRKNAGHLLYTRNTTLPSGGIVSMGNVTPEMVQLPGYATERVFGIPGAVGKLNVVFLSYPEFVVVTFSAPMAFNGRGQLDDLISTYQQHFSAAAT